MRRKLLLEEEKGKEKLFHIGMYMLNALLRLLRYISFSFLIYYSYNVY